MNKLIHKALLCSTIGISLFSGCKNSQDLSKIKYLECERAELKMDIDALKYELAELQDKREELIYKGQFRLMTLILRLNKEHSSRFNFHQLDFLKPFPYGAENVAKADLSDGHINYFTGGMSVFMNEEKRKALLKKHNILLLYVAGCRDGEQVFKFMDAYNEPVDCHIEQKYGKSLLDLYNQPDH